MYHSSLLQGSSATFTPPSGEEALRDTKGGQAGGRASTPSSLLFLQAHPHLPSRLPGLRVLRLLWCCFRDPRARSGHQVLAQREMGLHRRPLRVPPLRHQEICSQDHVMERRASLLRCSGPGLPAGKDSPGFSELGVGLFFFFNLVPLTPSSCLVPILHCPQGWKVEGWGQCVNVTTF